MADTNIKVEGIAYTETLKVENTINDLSDYEKESLSKVKQNLIRVRNFLLEKRYRLHGSVTSLISYMDNNSFDDRTSLLYTKLDNLTFYLKSRGKIPFYIENQTVPFLEKSKAIVKNMLKKREALRENKTINLTNENHQLMTELKQTQAQLESLRSRKVVQNDQNKSFGMLQKVVLFTAIVFFMYLTFSFGKTRAKFKKRKDKIIWKTDTHLEDSLRGQALVTLGKDGSVLRLNSTGEDWLQGSLSVSDSWNDYVAKYFYQDPSLATFKGFFRNRLFPHYVFKLHYSSNLKTKNEIVQLVRFNLNSLNRLARSQSHPSLTHLTYELFDNQIDRLIETGCSNKFIAAFDLFKVANNAEYLYLSEFEGKRIVRDYLSILNIALTIKSNLQLKSIKVSRENAQVSFKAILVGDSFSSRDFTPEKSDLKKKMDAFKERYNAILDALEIKNIIYNDHRETILECSVNDLQSYVNKKCNEKRESYREANA